MKILVWWVLTLAGVSQMVQAQNVEPRVSSASQAWEQWRTGTAPATVDLPSRQQDRDAAARRGARTAHNQVSAAGANIGKALGMGEEADSVLKALEDVAGDNNARRTQNAIRQSRQALERAGLLDDGDRDYEPRGVPEGQPEVPSSCEGRPECQECFIAAKTDLDSTRHRLERLRAIYSSTMSDTKAKIAFADGASAVHGVSALAWQKYKMDITQSVKGLKHAYDNKYAELITQLHTDLQGLSHCEATIMQTPDWYDRFGFIYYQFMKDRYKRID